MTDPSPDPRPDLPGSWTGFALLCALAFIGVVAFVALAMKFGPAPKPTAPAHWQGRVHYVLFCASAARGEVGLDVTDAVDELVFPALPRRVDLTLVVSMTPDRPGRRYQVHKLDPGAERGQVQELKVAEVPGHASITVLQIPGLEIERPGDVRFQVLCDGAAIAERVLAVGVKAPAAPGK